MSLLNRLNDINGRILLLEVYIEGDIFVLVNFYNNNIESDQLYTLSELNDMLNKVTDISRKKLSLEAILIFSLIL